MALWVIALGVLAAGVVVARRAPGSTVPITDERGRPVPGSRLLEETRHA